MKETILLKLSTSRFGDIDINPEQIVIFQQGIPGFDQQREFIILEIEHNLPFAVLQSVEDGDVSFILANPFILFPSYEFQLPDVVRDELGIALADDCVVWSIVSIRESLADATMNLLAPIVINARERRGKQIVLTGTAYQTKHPLSFANEAGRKKEAEAHAGSVPQEG